MQTNRYLTAQELANLGSAEFRELKTIQFALDGPCLLARLAWQAPVAPAVIVPLLPDVARRIAHQLLQAADFAEGRGAAN